MSHAEKIQDCEKCNTAKIAALLDKYDNFLFDCDGVLWEAGEVLPNVPESLKLLRKLGKRIFFVTNNSSRSRKQYQAKFAKFEIEGAVDEIYCSAYAAVADGDSSLIGRFLKWIVPYFEFTQAQYEELSHVIGRKVAKDFGFDGTLTISAAAAAKMAVVDPGPGVRSLENFFEQFFSFEGHFSSWALTAKEISIQWCNPKRVFTARDDRGREFQHAPPSLGDSSTSKSVALTDADKDRIRGYAVAVDAFQQSSFAIP